MKFLNKQDTLAISGGVYTNTPSIVEILGLSTKCIVPYRLMAQAIIRETEAINHTPNNIKDFNHLKNIYKMHAANMPKECQEHLGVYMVYEIMNYTA